MQSGISCPPSSFYRAITAQWLGGVIFSKNWCDRLCEKGAFTRHTVSTRVLELFTPPLLFYPETTLWKLYFLTAKFPAQFLPSLQFLPFIARKYPEFLPNVISSGTLGIPDENLHIISTKRQFLFFYYVKIHTISPKYNFYLLFSIEIRKDHAVKGETNCMKLCLKGARSAPKFFEILFLPS